MGRRRAGGRGVYPRRLTNDLVKIIKRVFPLFEGAGTHQARWSILAIRKLWKDVNFHWDSLGRKDRFGVREHLSDLHISCASGCTDKEAHMLFQSLFDEYEIKGKEAVEVSAESVYMKGSLTMSLEGRGCSRTQPCRQSEGGCLYLSSAQGGRQAGPP